ncbi:MAG: malto-oligosyltrehalose trehalohydrolase [Candidatus Abyssubacteria bacterium]
MISEVSLGAVYLGENRCSFRVWAPFIDRVEVHIIAPHDRLLPLHKDERGYHHAVVEDVKPGARYLFRLDEVREFPDPASRLQPEGVHEPSEVVTPDFTWEDRHWFGLPLRDYITYEAHAGTFSSDGTFEAIISCLDELKALGVTALELMPVGQFPGTRNWGYDVAYPFAVQWSYGGPSGLKRLVNACHQREMAFILDVVYNHLGPEGNYLGQFAPYFTDRYKTPWGQAVNFDGPYSDEVRRYFIENALYWIADFHVDALRIDAVHAILDFSAQPFLEELALAVANKAEQLNRRIHLIAETDLNDSKLVRSRELGGYGLDAQWNDDFHHSLHCLLTGEKSGYYLDFGRLSHMAKAFREGYVFSGQYSSFRKRKHGNSSTHIPAERFVVFSQNHDQVGNRILGERLSQLAPFEALKLAAAAVLLSPCIPLLFMGEEYGEVAPFQYFVSHNDPELVEAVRRGRREEFNAFQWQGEPPDPQSELTFNQCKLNRRLKNDGQHAVLFEFYRELIHLRRTLPALSRLTTEGMEISEHEHQGVLVVTRSNDSEKVALLFNFKREPARVEIDLQPGAWVKLFDSAEQRWFGPGATVQEKLISRRPPNEAKISLPPLSVVLFAKKPE